MGNKIVFTENCMGCGQCLEVCKSGALYCEGYSVRYDASKCVSCLKCVTDVECSGDCFAVATIDTVSELEPRIELPMSYKEVL